MGEGRGPLLHRVLPAVTPQNLCHRQNLSEIIYVLVGTLCVMHKCVKKHQNVRIRDPPVPHFSYVGIRDPPVPNNVIRKKTLVRIREPSVRGSNNHSVVGRATVKNRPIQHFFHISNQRTVGSFLFWCFQFKFGIRESLVLVIKIGQLNHRHRMLHYLIKRGQSNHRQLELSMIHSQKHRTPL